MNLRSTSGFRAAVVVAGFVSTFARADPPQDHAGCVPLTANFDVTGDVTFCPGTYALDDPEQDGVIRVKASNVTIDLRGVTLSGSAFQGFGIRGDGVDDVSIKGATIRGFKSAIYLSDGSGHEVHGCDLSHNRKRPVTHTAADFLSVWPDLAGQFAADQIGNGLLLERVRGASIRRNRCGDQQNGIGLFRCSNVELVQNDCDANEGWGIHVHRSSNNLIAHNSADDNFNKLSDYCHQVQQDGCDTAALLLIKDSNDNLVIGNSLRNSGDGVFSAAQEGATHWGADRNRYVANDCSFAKHIGLESTFSDQNEFVQNLANDAGRYGFWLGYSKNVRLRANQIRRNALAGISNESVLNALYLDNDISENKIGVELRRGTFYALDQDSRGHVFLHNTVRDNTDRGLSIVDTHQVTIRENEISMNLGGNVKFGAAKVLDIQGPLEVVDNNLLGAGVLPWTVWNEQKTPLDLTGNWWGTTDPAAISASIKGLDQYALVPPHRLPRLEIVFLLGAEGPYTLARVVNQRACDATDTSDGQTLPRGNALDSLHLGRVQNLPGAPSFVAGLRFADVYLPPDATVLAARLVLPTDGPHAELLTLRVFGEAADSAAPFEAGSLPSTRARTAAWSPWRVAEPWAADGWAVSPDLSAIVLEVLARSGWQSGNALALLIEDGGGSQGFRRAWSFEREGYATLAGTPYEFRRFRRYRFAKLELEYDDGGAEMVLEREHTSGADDADGCVACNEVHLGFLGSSSTGGFRFADCVVPKSASVTSARVWLATDGTYTNALSLRLFGELSGDAPPYASGDLPAGRPRTAGFVDWAVSDTWKYLDWHATPELAPLFAEVIALPDWSSGHALALDVLDHGSTGHRRVWAFDRDPRVLPHDFPQIGATPFVPFRDQPVSW